MIEKLALRKLGKKRKNRRTLIKNICSFSMILIIVTCLIVLMFQTSLRRNLNEFNDQYQMSLLDAAAEKTLGRLNDAVERVQRLMTQKELSPICLGIDVPKMMAVQRELTKLSSIQDLVYEAVIVSEGRDLALSNITSYRIEYFTQRMQDSLVSSCESFDQVIAVCRDHQMLSVTMDGKCMISLNLRYALNFRDSYLMLLIPAEKLIGLYTDSLGELDQIVGMIYFDGAVLPDDQPLTEAFPAWETLETEQKVSYDGVRYRVLKADYPQQHVGFVYLIDEAFYEAPVKKTMLQCLLWLLGIFIVGNLLIVLLSYYNYKPVERLQRVLERALNKTPRESQSDLHFIETGIDELIEENGELNVRLHTSKKNLHNFCLFKLLNGPLDNLEKVKETLEEIGIELDGECFQCISVSLTYSKDVERFTSYIEQERKSLSPYYHLYYVSSGTNITLMFNFTDENSSIMENLLEHFSQFYVKEIPMSMGIGSRVMGIAHLQESYQQSRLALRHASTEEELHMSHFSKIELDGVIEKIYNSKHVESLIAAIHRDDPDTISKELETIRHFVAESHMPRYAIKVMYYQIVNGILSTVHNPVLFEKANDLLMAIDETLQHYTLEQVHAQLEELCYQLVSQTSGVVLLDTILDYINEHYADLDFSISNMAEHFQMSHQSMIALFKREMHVTIIEYITSCKISAAENLLLHTDLPVSAIVKRVGYIDNSSFTRKFKAIMGITPVEYRKTHQNAD